MKNNIFRSMFALTLVAAISGAVFAGEKKGSVTFSRDINVNGTVVKAGTYNVKFDEGTQQVQILKGKNAVATTSAKLTDRTRKASNTEVNYSRQGDNAILTGITFGGDTQTLSIDSGAQAASPANN
ncbi:MAG TPA: hypothetical protein PLB18_07015 [Acidobacteriota bacterium]|nr:hypothetical protein [Acidobacteriota bacterium]HND19105.1 hypothetical protein [Acidobacteriota bacterium]HNH82482.1 hypothetical protein [Acidobacteriota bacterium]